MENRVVITGMGIWSCLGQTLEDVRQALYDGKSGIIFSQERKDMGYRSGLCTHVPMPDLKKKISRTQRQFMPMPLRSRPCRTQVLTKTILTVTRSA